MSLKKKLQLLYVYMGVKYACRCMHSTISLFVVLELSALFCCRTERHYYITGGKHKRKMVRAEEQVICLRETC